MVTAILSRIVIVTAGVLYPAYSSFKAVRRKSHREYTKWMMYWIVFALFISTEVVLDTFIYWLPLYYELKIVFVMWLVLPITEGSKQLYRVVVHPFLLRYEGRIDQYIAKAGQSTFQSVRRLSQAGLNRVASTLLTSAIRGQAALAENLLQNNGTNETDGSPSPSQGSEPVSTAREGRGSTASSSELEPFEMISDTLDEDVYEVRPQAVQKEFPMTEPQREQGIPVAGSSYLSSSDTFYMPLDLEEESNLYKKTY